MVFAASNRTTRSGAAFLVCPPYEEMSDEPLGPADERGGDEPAGAARRKAARPSKAGQRKVTAENLARLGAERLAEILVQVAESRADLKRRLRMELAAEHGTGPLAAEIDKRLASLETSRGKITWRQRPAFIRDLEALRELIGVRLAGLDEGAATERLWRFMDAARQVGTRYRERDDELTALFARAAADLGGLLAGAAPGPAAAQLVESLAKNPLGWRAWAPDLLARASKPLAQEALRFIGERPAAAPGWIGLIRQLADAAGDADTYRATYTPEAARAPAAAAAIARRLLAAGRIEDAGQVLVAAAPRGRVGSGVDFEWESAWLEVLERSGRQQEAQDVRWESFQRTLSVERAKDFIGRLPDFDDVEAEARAFLTASTHPDFKAGLAFLMEWPALPEASRMIEARSSEADVDPQSAELWAGKLRRRYPNAAQHLLRRAAAAAFRRRDYATCDRLTEEAETISL